MRKKIGNFTLNVTMVDKENPLTVDDIYLNVTTGFHLIHFKMNYLKSLQRDFQATVSLEIRTG